MCACFGVRPPLRTLQSMHAHTTFSHEPSPPWLRGTMWSRLRSLVANFLPQYWHWLLSRAKMLRRFYVPLGLGPCSRSVQRGRRRPSHSPVSAHPPPTPPPP